MIYTYKGQKYELVEMNGRMKHPETREWVPAVIYKSLATQFLFAREREDFITKFKPFEHIPYHIRVIAKFYPILDKTDGNISTGEIRKFNITDPGSRKVGQRVIGLEIIDNEDYDAIWVHVGNDYFKMIGLWPCFRTC